MKEQEIRKSLAGNLRKFRLRAGLTAKEVGEKIGKSDKTVSGWEHGRGQPDADMLFSLCEIYQIDSIAAFYSGDESENNDNLFGIENHTQYIPLKTVPVVGTIACGTPITAVENLDGEAQIASSTHADFALRCKGDSMYPLLNDGDLVFIRQQDTVDDGQIAAVLINEEATLKHIYRKPEGIFLVSENHRFPPFIADGDIRILGKAVAFQRAI